jgi:putative pyruvate formate lyase activating enzyme
VCRSDAGFNIASVCIHLGEEPVISGLKGICNIFFTACNLQCIYCQNFQISDTRSSRTMQTMDPEQVVASVTAILDRGINRVGFVSPSHFIPQMQVIIGAVESLGYRPVWVYNTNGYDRPETLRMLEETVGVYLPDFKYMDPQLAWEYSGARDYPAVAMAALKEMKRQKGAVLHTDDGNLALYGIIVRHLVLPGHVENSVAVLRFLAEEISPKIHVSLMSQYYPTARVASHPVLGRGLTLQEYNRVTEEMDRLGLSNGWIQEFESNEFYRPDFSRSHPFE